MGSLAERARDAHDKIVHQETPDVKYCLGRMARCKCCDLSISVDKEMVWVAEEFDS